MEKREDYERERENALWRMSIKRMWQSGDLDGLIDLKESPECLDDEIIDMLDEFIKELKDKEKARSQAEE